MQEVANSPADQIGAISSIDQNPGEPLNIFGNQTHE